ncbi:hypothetical protein OB905_05215 [Halobacteria archaeon AArc-dxtr1]|nr:hypothetical protein [Halobacteria archaeon AArc-dxtr1]
MLVRSKHLCVTENETSSQGQSGGVHPDAVERTFDWRGWVLVCAIVLAFVIAPLVILLIPPGVEGYRFALLIVPLVPAVLLALTAVWATTRP